MTRLRPRDNAVRDDMLYVAVLVKDKDIVGDDVPGWALKRQHKPM